MRIPEREQRVWAFFHKKGLNSCLDVPRAPAANFNWTKLQTQAEYARTSAGKTQLTFQLSRERKAPFPSVVAFPLRWVPNGKKYRLYCWLHRHEKPAGGNTTTWCTR
ncbi:hypothetical protein PG996_007775 [Apiospora saccharicola]|uniref:Uncharacterized protein n=1 Tax=Apiospora saccharicola TaxID=335842 RepID=A0ABR1UZ98_9PEZI